MKFLQLTVLGLFFISTLLIAQKAGDAIQFNGINDYISVPTNQCLNPGTGSWTICMWIKAQDTVQAAPLISKRVNSTGYNQYTIGIGNTSPYTPSAGRKIFAGYIGYAGSSERSGYTQNDVVDGNWHHIAFVADTTADSIFFYIDGQKWTTILSNKSGNWPNVGNDIPLTIAFNNYNSQFYQGQMDEVSVWNKALTANQINIVMNDTLSAAYYSTTDSGLVAYYRFDKWEDLGVNVDGADDIRDFSVYNNHGDAYGSPLLVLSGAVASVEDEMQLPTEFQLYQNYPNPFNPITKIKYSIPTSSLVILKIYDILGREIEILINEEKPSGDYEVEFDGGEITSGIYFYRIQAGDYVETKKMVLMK